MCDLDSFVGNGNGCEQVEQLLAVDISLGRHRRIVVDQEADAALAAGRRQSKQVALGERVDAGRVVEQDDEAVRIGDPARLPDQVLEPFVPQLGLSAGPQRGNVDEAGQHGVQLLRRVCCPRHQLWILRGQVTQQSHRSGQSGVERVDPEPEGFGGREESHRHALQESAGVLVTVCGDLPAVRSQQRRGDRRTCLQLAHTHVRRNARADQLTRTPAGVVRRNGRETGREPIREQTRGRLSGSEDLGRVGVHERARFAAGDRGLFLQLTMQLHSPLMLAVRQAAGVLQQLPERMLETADPRLQELRGNRSGRISPVRLLRHEHRPSTSAP